MDSPSTRRIDLPRHQRAIQQTTIQRQRRARVAPFIAPSYASRASLLVVIRVAPAKAPRFDVSTSSNSRCVSWTAARRPAPSLIVEGRRPATLAYVNTTQTLTPRRRCLWSAPCLCFEITLVGVFVVANLISQPGVAARFCSLWRTKASGRRSDFTVTVFVCSTIGFGFNGCGTAGPP